MKRAFFLALTLAAKCTVFAADKKPNIIFFLIDDQRYDMLSMMGHSFVETPNIDSLASKGVYFKEAFATTSLSSPSRASMVTGQYAHVHQVVNNDTDLNPETPTYAKELQKGGYRTAHIGKWHMGHATDERREGYDYWVSFNGQGQYLNPKVNVNDERKKFNGEHLTDVLTDLACQYIVDSSKGDQPYFLCLAHKAVHENFQPAERHHGRYIDQEITLPDSYAATEENFSEKPDWVRKQRASWHGSERDYVNIDNVEGDNIERLIQLYAETMLGVDDSVGKVIKTLEELGELDNTVIIYMADNGYLLGEHGLIDKRVMYEESIRLPAFMYWGDNLKAGSQNDDFVLNIDIAPTILDCAQLPIPETMQGESFLPLAKGEEVEWREDFIYEYFVDPAAVMTPTIFGLRNKQYSYMTYYGVWDNNELYDIQSDPDQRDNLLSDIVYGQSYGSFLQCVVKQDKELAPQVRKLENRLNFLLEKYDGQRHPLWVNTSK